LRQHYDTIGSNVDYMVCIRGSRGRWLDTYST